MWILIQKAHRNFKPITGSREVYVQSFRIKSSINNLFSATSVLSKISIMSFGNIKIDLDGCLTDGEKKLEYLL